MLFVLQFVVHLKTPNTTGILCNYSGLPDTLVTHTGTGVNGDASWLSTAQHIRRDLVGFQ